MDDLAEYLTEIKHLKISSSLIGSVFSRANISYSKNLENPFCNEPMNYVLHKSLLNVCDFESMFIKPAKNVLNAEDVAHKSQDLIVSGYQTAGNIFANDNHFSTEAEKFIRDQVEEYRKKFSRSEEGLIKYWPSKYSSIKQ